MYQIEARNIKNQQNQISYTTLESIDKQKYLINILFVFRDFESWETLTLI